ncbi:Protein UGT-49 [Aphelenchoides avenae]|nr:Protein UGT-49 [Aphelenchus avenae]
MRLHQCLILTCFGTIIPLCTGLKAVIFSINIGYSHVQFDAGLADLLVDAGHEAHVVIAEWDPKVTANGTEKAQKITRYLPRDPENLRGLLEGLAFRRDHFSHGVDTFGLVQMRLIKRIMQTHCNDILSNEEFIAGLKQESYDVGIAEVFDICAFDLFRLLDIKTTFVTTSVSLNGLVTWNLGIPQPASFIPDVNASPLTVPDMPYMDRVQNLYRLFVGTSMLLREFRADFPTWAENLNRASFHFINSNEFLDIARPISHKIKYIGGARMKKAKALQGRLLEVANRARSGVVYFSFGSIVDTESMPVEVRDAFLRSFTKFPEYEFIWKFAGPGGNVSHYFDAYPNVHAFKWVDQVSLLAHPKTKAFIMHCGMNSLQEAAYYGVPLIGVPFFGDQTYNAAIIHHKQLGIVLQKDKLTEEAVTDALRRVLGDEKYRNNMEMVSRKLRSAPYKPDEIFVKWVEFAHVFEGDLQELSLASAQMSWLTYYSLDIIFPVIALAAVSLYAGYCFLRLLGTAKAEKEKTS